MRPFVAELARGLELAGWVRNDGGGVVLEVEGGPEPLDRFAEALSAEAPAAASIDVVRWQRVRGQGDRGFTIVDSRVDEAPSVGIAPDRRICGECLAEIRDPADRRFGHPFTTCLRCGPRFSVVQALPYDRARTSMASFPMCEACRADHAGPGPRRHAQALACPRCGPRLWSCASDGARLAEGDEALAATVEALRRGEIVALRGLGGFQLLVDATDEHAVARLRARKARPAKPLAVMVGSLEHARTLAMLGPVEADVLASPEGPIVLVRRRETGVAPSVAPDRARLGLMLPTTGIHALLLDRVRRPLVVTSGNRHEEPIAIGNDEALTRLAGIADLFLVHDREIVRRADDSVVQVVAGAPQVLRLGRGHAPLRVDLPGARGTTLAMGGHLKHAPALAVEGEAHLWPHVGDLSVVAAREAMARSVEDLERLVGRTADVVAIDAHPDYATTAWAEASGRPLHRVWHHHAHVAAVLAEHGATQALGLAWDGTGLGPDGTAWGGEVLGVDEGGARRVAHLHPFALPGADAAARDGRRALAGVLVAAARPAPSERAELRSLMSIARRPRLSARTTSMGRLIDAVAALVGVCERSRYEGEAASRLEELAEPGASPYSFTCDGTSLDWRPAIDELLRERHEPVRVASRFHATLCAMVVDVVSRSRASTVALAGGCFVNRRLTEAVVDTLSDRGVQVLLARRVPPSDGGLALGQAWIATRRTPCV